MRMVEITNDRRIQFLMPGVSGLDESDAQVMLKTSPTLAEGSVEYWAGRRQHHLAQFAEVFEPTTIACVGSCSRPRTFTVK